MSPSYGYAYLTSYGWAGTGTGLRKGAIERPLAIPPKKNLSGLGKDRDEAFPFWDHLFAAASKAIAIKVSSDDEDAYETEVPRFRTPTQDISSHIDPLRRTATGILSNRRPISGTPAPVSGSSTPNLHPDAGAPNTNAGTAGRLSLLAIAKREAAKRGLYARFFRGPVLGPDTTFHSAPESSESSSSSTPVPEHVCGGQDIVVGERKKSKKRKSEDRSETKEERRERKRLKPEHKAVRAIKDAEKVLGEKKAKGGRDGLDRKAQRHQDKGVQSEEHKTYSNPKKACKQAQKAVAGSMRDDPEQVKCKRKKSKAHPASMNNGQRNFSPNNVDATDSDTLNIVLKAKKKGKRKDTPS